MLALLSALMGFVTSMAPEALKFLQDNKDKKHELEMMAKRAELGLEQSKQERNTAEVKSITDAYTEAQRSYREELKAAETSWVASYSATVRPTITYLFFILYTVVKVKILIYALGSLGASALPWQIETAMNMMWTEEDVMMFSWVIGFWLGNRSMQKR